jgi:hypothetical protein
MPRLGLVCLTIVAAFQAHLATAGDVSQDVPVPGGTAAMAESLGLVSTPDPARFVAELARLTYPAAETTQTTRAKALNAWRSSRGKAQESQAVDIVPIPLNVTVWSRAVFHKAVAPEDIVAAILSDPRSAHLCYGLASSDDETLQFFIDHPNLLTWLHENAAAVFAAFGSSLRIRGNRVVVPGPAGSEAIWGSVVHEGLDRPEAFVRGLYGQDQGRLAYLYDTIAELDSPHAGFALGLQLKDAGDRLARFKALASINRTVLPQWQPAKFPFSRPPYDLANLLGRVRLEPDSSPSFPATRSLWTWIFDGLDVPADLPRLPLHPSDDGPVDAAWLAQAIVSEDLGVRSDRLDQLTFGQRAFAAVDAASLPDALAAIRGFPRSRMLMLTLERIGVRHPSVYVAAARRAQQLTSLEDRRQLVAIQQFQGALVLLARLALVRTLDVAACERLVVSLSTLAPTSDGRYAGAVAVWLDRDLRGALIAADVRLESPHVDDPRSVRLSTQDEFEPALVAALAGSRGDERRKEADEVSWEGQVYRLDLVATEVRRLQRVREKQGGPRIDVALTLATVARKLAASRTPSEEATAAAADLIRLAGDVPSGSDSLGHETVAHAIAELSKAGPRPDTHRLAQIAVPLSDVADEVLADSLATWAYALSIPDADSPVLLTGSVTRRHDFGFTTGPRKVRASGEWALPRPKIAVGVPWHVGGSLLGLDVALSAHALRRVDGNRVVDAPSLSTNEREAFAEAVALLDPLKLSDRELDVIVDAIARGRRRVASLAEDAAAFTTIAAEIRMDGWRQRAVRWTMAHEPARTETFFSLTEMLHLGGASAVELGAWGMSGIASAGCLCTRMAPTNQWRMLIGRPQFGLMASALPDLNLHVASVLRELRLPAAISKAVLTAAVQDFIDEVRPTDANDWLTLVRMARTAPRERIEDYVAAATADGPLVPVVSERGQ